MDYKARFLPQERLGQTGWRLVHTTHPKALDDGCRGSSRFNDANASRGVTIAFAGGLLLSLDVPLLKLSGADTFTIIYVRGAMLFAALFLYWLFFIRLRGNDTPFINGKTGMVLALLAGTANIMFVSSISMTSVANVVFILAFNPMFAGC
jgi:drug/metabolite transporter (DMT)-like permease